MPKRKRPTYEPPPSLTQDSVLETLVQSKKLLHRALKPAKGFERQKLGKRLKIAQSKGVDGKDDVVRINREIEALKGLDLGEMVERYLYGRVLKVKRMAECECLPEEVRMKMKSVEKEKEGGTEEEKVLEKAALTNVMSGMFNMKGVKEVMGEVMKGLYLAMEIPMPEEVGKVKGVDKKNKEMESNGTTILPRKPNPADGMEVDTEPAWEGFDSEDEETSEPKPIIEDGDDSDLDSEDLSRYDALLGSSDAESEPESESDYPTKQHPQSTTRLSLSLSPSPPHNNGYSFSPSPSPPPSSKRLTATKTKLPPKPTKQTTFLPTLLGGYYSGSDSDSIASELDDHPSLPVRKNRPGQMARRAIAEKKFGAKANHITSGQGPVAEMGKGRKGDGEGDGWDAKRGAKDSRGRGRGRGGFRGDSGREREREARNFGTGENSIAVTGRGERGRAMGKKDDAGILHPSWQAAKKAKELKNTATFQGKKVTFD